MDMTNLNGYLVPKMAMKETHRPPVGRIGLQREKFLQENHSLLYDKMLLDGTLYSDLKQTEQRYWEQVEQTITKPMEQSMSTLDKIKDVTSTSQNSVSMVLLEFEDGVNMDTVSVDIQQKISALQASWDDTVSSPYVLKMNPSMIPTLRYQLTCYIGSIRRLRFIRMSWDTFSQAHVYWMLTTYQALGAERIRPL